MKILWKQKMINVIIDQIKSFRAELYELIYKRRDAAMDLIDSLCSNIDVDSVIKLSLSDVFRRKYSSIVDAISNFFPSVNKPEQLKNIELQDKGLNNLVLNLIPSEDTRGYVLFGLDCTPISRPFSFKLEDRHVTYKPNPILNNKPITIGHSLSAVVYLPYPGVNSWVLPISMNRVSSNEKGADVGLTKITDILENPTLNDKLVVAVGDTNYSTRSCQKISSQKDNLVLLTRASSNRKLFYQPDKSLLKKSGHPKWYGDAMILSDEKTHRSANYEDKIERVTSKGKTLTIKISCWYDMLMKSHKTFATHQYPFTLVRVCANDSEGKDIYKKPLWLMVFGKKRTELKAKEIYDNYCQRYDIEHFFRFAKQRLLLESYQTPEVKHEETWWQFVKLAYVQLFLCKELSEKLPNPWEVYLPNYKGDSQSTPSQVLRDFKRLVNQEIGTPAKECKPRGKSLGRKKGYKPQERLTKTIVLKKKSKKIITPEIDKSASLTKPKSYSKVLEKITGLIEKNGMSISDFLKKAYSELPVSI